MHGGAEGYKGVCRWVADGLQRGCREGPAIDRLKENALAGIDAVPQLHQSRHVPLWLLVKYASVRYSLDYERCMGEN